MRSAAFALALALLAAFGTQAGAPDKLFQPAGPRPDEAAARQAVIGELRKKIDDPLDAQRVRFYSGPQLVSGTNFADGREQAWLMCVVEGTGRLSRGPLELQLQPYLLRSREGRVEVVPLAAWKDTPASC